LKPQLASVCLFEVFLKTLYICPEYLDNLGLKVNDQSQHPIRIIKRVSDNVIQKASIIEFIDRKRDFYKLCICECFWLHPKVVSLKPRLPLDVKNPQIE
jgi:hypothetical protein